MAEALLRHRLSERGLDVRYRVRSAGVIARDGGLAPPMALRAGSEHGVDLSLHGATRLTAELIRGADLVVAMDRSNAEDILNLVPDVGRRLCLLSQFAADSPDFDIPDPMGASIEAFRESYRRIAAGIDGLVGIMFKAEEAGEAAE
jgi:protein-tyrosine phosphatase